MLVLNDISKTYGEVVALKNASFSIDSGEIVALLGANGSGKSTMVKILGGSVKKDSGTIEMEGRVINVSSSEESRKFGFAVAYQELSLLPQMTVWENVMLGHYIVTKFGRIDAKANREYVQALIDKFEIDCQLDDYPRDLSSSTLSLIEIIKAISWQPRLLLLDEVTATLHHNEVSLLFNNLREYAKAGMSIVMVTHRLEEVFQIASRAQILRNGESVANLKLEATDIDTIIYYMTGKRPDHSKEKVAPNAENSETVVLEVKGAEIAGRVNGVNMQLHKGEIIGFGGLEGQGQSDFLRALYGVHSLDNGTIELNSETVKFASPADAVKNGIGFISGDRNRESVFSERTIGENIYSAKLSEGSMLGFLTAGQINRKTMMIVQDYGIKIGKITDPISSLSGGNQQKVVFGRWIYELPDILLLDDPTKGVDVAARAELHEFLRTAAAKGMTVIMVSSDNTELLEVSDRIYVFYEGKVQAILSGDDRTEERLVSAMMGIGKKEDDHNA